MARYLPWFPCLLRFLRIFGGSRIFVAAHPARCAPIPPAPAPPAQPALGRDGARLGRRRPAPGPNSLAMAKLRLFSLSSGESRPGRMAAPNAISTWGWVQGL